MNGKLSDQDLESNSIPLGSMRRPTIVQKYQLSAADLRRGSCNPSPTNANREPTANQTETEQKHPFGWKLGQRQSITAPSNEKALRHERRVDFMNK